MEELQDSYNYRPVAGGAANERLQRFDGGDTNTRTNYPDNTARDLANSYGNSHNTTDNHRRTG